jgi:hypothetical protein
MERDLPDIRMNAAGLYREEVFTDRRVGTIHKLIPIMPDGSDDQGRPVVFEGQTSVLTPAGSLPLIFEIEAGTLADAVEKFSGAAREALEHALKELEELRRAAASSLIVPAVGSPDVGGLAGPAGLRGGGRIRMP